MTLLACVSDVMQCYLSLFFSLCIPPSVFSLLRQMLQMTVSTSITLMFEATLCFVRLPETDINPLFLLQTDKSMKWRCHTCRQWKGQFGFDGPAKALLLPVTVRTLQIGNPGEIICKEHVHRWCRIQLSQRVEMRKSQKSKQPDRKPVKAFQSFYHQQNISTKFPA